jgi:DNA-binding beta-propeller fold protein YncE
MGNEPPARTLPVKGGKEGIPAMQNLRQRARWLAVVAGLFGLFAGCATAPVTKPKADIFFPPPPAAARLQFLKSFSSERDLGGGPGRFFSFIVGKEPPKKPIGKPYGVALHDGKLYVCDTGSSAIEILDLQKKQLRYFTPAREGALRTPVNIAVDHDGTRYVADTGRGQVVIFAADDRYLGAIGEKVLSASKAHSKAPAAATETPAAAPSFAGKVDEMKPTDVAVAGDRLYVSDLKNNRVRVYDKAARKLLFTIPADPAAEDPQARLYAPVNLAVDAQRRLYVTDIGAFRVQQYDPDGKFLRTIGRLGDSPGEFARPKGVAVDRDGRVYVVDAAAQLVQIFDAEGKLLLFFGEPEGSEVGLNLPAKVAIDYDHVGLFQGYAAPDFQVEYLVVVTNQYGDRKVSVFGYGRKK